jgi:hypothetical protein
MAVIDSSMKFEGIMRILSRESIRIVYAVVMIMTAGFTFAYSEEIKPPVPSWIHNTCLGEVEGEVFTNQPGMILKKIDIISKYNFNGFSDDVQTIDTTKASWNAKVNNLLDTAFIEIMFSAGHPDKSETADTLIRIDYYPKGIVVEENTNFGLLKSTQEFFKSFYLKNLSNQVLEVDSLVFQTGLFEIEFIGDNQPPYEIEPRDSVPFNVKFGTRAARPEPYVDSIGYKTVSCGFRYTTEFSVEVSDPIIEAEGFDFGLVTVNTTKIDTFDIVNKGKTGLGIKSISGSNQEFVVRDTNDQELKTPFTIEPNSKFRYIVKFKPVSTGLHTAQIKISSDAGNKPEHEILFTGFGVFLDVEIRDADFGKKLIHREEYPVVPSTKNIIIRNRSTEDTLFIIGADDNNVGDKAPFAYDIGEFEDMVILPDTFKIVECAFQPKKTGKKYLRIDLILKDGSSLPVELNGYGCLPRIKMSGLHFDSNFVKNSEPLVGKVKIWNIDYGANSFPLKLDSLRVMPYDSAISKTLDSWGWVGFKYDSTKINFNQEIPVGDSLEIEVLFSPRELGTSYAQLGSASSAEKDTTVEIVGYGKSGNFLTKLTNLNICVSREDTIFYRVVNVTDVDFYVTDVIFESEVFEILNREEIEYFKAKDTTLIKILFSPKETGEWSEKLIIQNSSSLQPELITNIKAGSYHRKIFPMVDLLEDRSDLKQLVWSEIVIPIDKKTADEGISQLSIELKFDSENLFPEIDSLFLKSARGFEYILDAMPHNGENLSFSLRKINDLLKWDTIRVEVPFYFRYSSLNEQVKESKLILSICQLGGNCVLFDSDTTSFTIEKINNEIIGSQDVENMICNLEIIRPNPVFHKELSIDFSLEENAFTVIYLLNSQGRIIRPILEKQISAGQYTGKIDISGVSSGTYWILMKAGNCTHSRRFAIVR